MNINNITSQAFSGLVQIGEVNNIEQEKFLDKICDRGFNSYLDNFATVEKLQEVNNQDVAFLPTKDGRIKLRLISSDQCGDFYVKGNDGKIIETKIGLRDSDFQCIDKKVNEFCEKIKSHLANSNPINSKIKERLERNYEKQLNRSTCSPVDVQVPRIKGTKINLSSFQPACYDQIED